MPNAGMRATKGAPGAARRTVTQTAGQRVLKSAVRTPVDFRSAPGGGPSEQQAVPMRITTPADARQAQLAFYLGHLSATTNKRGKPYAEGTIKGYSEAVRVLLRYLETIEFEGGCESIDVETLNGFSRDYHASHGQGGTVTKVGNLRMFFRWLMEEYDAAEVYNHPKRNIYARPDEPPPVLSEEFLDDLLKATEGKDFASVRDNAIIRLFLTGVRISEMGSLLVEDLDLRSPIKTITTGRIKGNAGRALPLAANTLKALHRWLRSRAEAKTRPDAFAGALWLSAKGGHALSNSGIYQMLKRRAEEAGYDPDSIHPHLFRHTAAHQFLAGGGSTGDAMQYFGWRDEAMAHRYGRSAAAERAVVYAAKVGFGNR